jgi:hypothetical protein
VLSAGNDKKRKTCGPGNGASTYTRIGLAPTGFDAFQLAGLYDKTLACVNQSVSVALPLHMYERELNTYARHPRGLQPAAF